MAGVASSGALIRVPSFSRWQNSSLICTPGYGEAPEGRNRMGGWVGGEQATTVQPRPRIASVLALHGRLLGLLLPSPTASSSSG